MRAVRERKRKIVKNLVDVQLDLYEESGAELVMGSGGFVEPKTIEVACADRAGPPDAQTQRAGIAPPHAEGDGLSGVTSDRESNAFISGPAGVVGGVPLTRAMNPWAMPEAST